MESPNEDSSKQALSIYSLNHVQRYIASSKISQAFDIYSAEIEKTKSEKEIVALLINRAFAALELQMTKRAIADASTAIELDQYASAAYFIRGIANLWNKNEDGALASWKIGLQFTEELSFYTLMTALVNSQNFRANLFKTKFDVNNLFNLIDDFASPRFTVDSDIQDAFSELRNNSIEFAIEHFSMILKANPQNHYAYKGRGVAYCMVGEYQKCIQDLTTAIEKTPNSFQTDTVKVRAIAFAATGNITRALIDLNKYLLIMHDDYEVKIEVARLHMRRKTYLPAHKIFLTIPEKEFDQKGFLSFAECLYAVGELENAFLILQKVVNIHDHKYLYLKYLIDRDLNKISEAINDIVEAVKLVPTFFLLRTAADFFCDIGDIESALVYFEEALQQCPYDAETQLFYAHALFESGKLQQSAQLLRELAIENEKFKFSGSLEHFNKMNLGIDLLKNAQEDCYLVITAMQSIDACIMKLPRDLNFVTIPDDIPSDFKLLPFEVTPQVLQMVKDADRFGRRCIPQTHEKTVNLRLARALGFCVLRMAQMMKTQWFDSNQKRSWLAAFDEIRAILSFADLRKPLIYSHDTTDSFIHNAPTYYVMKNGRISSRFGFIMEKIFQKMRKYYPLERIECFEDIYQITQSDSMYKSKWSLEKGTVLDVSTLLLKYNGIYGFDICVRPQSDDMTWRLYDTELQEAFQNLMNNRDKTTLQISYFILLIWLRQPLNYYSPEIGHMFLHAYYLASNESELAPLDESNGEYFISEMVEPNLNQLSASLYDHVIKCGAEKEYKEESLQFWSTMPSISTMIQLMNVKYE
ncbi:hypothetical protein TRFO_25462 [Tritrichomonas foetus]|uniref:TPR Domain containing protein n=1 Tax=Tritrichomonas foetus TaxID=1144522 RepID=A0A1J4K9Z3_9EUKA|nr:hypothetical protein TRFO_25462 [Tritrichomonas foetus]|eukprot:OHT06508.1 hypothetical protein TRFO_25462 [Tritrichomonas foetus]